MSGSGTVTGSRFKYAPLARYLAAQPPEVTTVTLLFAEIERIIGAPLPVSAHTLAWWSNSPRSSTHAWVWLDVEWRVQRPNLRLRDRSVTFVRVVVP